MGKGSDNLWDKLKKKAIVYTATAAITLTGVYGASTVLKQPENEEEVVKEIGETELEYRMERLGEVVKDRGRELFDRTFSSEEDLENFTEDEFNEKISELMPEMDEDDRDDFYDMTMEHYSTVRNHDGIGKAMDIALDNFDTLEEYSEKNDVPLPITVGVLMEESGGGWYLESGTGNRGAFQLSEYIAEYYDLKVNENVDERNDIEKSASAATRYLSDLKKRFGTWDLAVLGYHQGTRNLGNFISDYLEKHEGENLSLSRVWERNIGSYDLDIPDLLSDRELVEEHFKEEDPLSGSCYVQKVLLCMDRFEDRLESNEELEVDDYSIHIVEKGEYLNKIAEDHGVEPEVLYRHNAEIKNPDDIHPRMELKIRNGSKYIDTSGIIERYQEK